MSRAKGKHIDALKPGPVQRPAFPRSAGSMVFCSDMLRADLLSQDTGGNGHSVQSAPHDRQSPEDFDVGLLVDHDTGNIARNSGMHWEDFSLHGAGSERRLVRGKSAHRQPLANRDVGGLIPRSARHYGQSTTAIEDDAFGDFLRSLSPKKYVRLF